MSSLPYLRLVVRIPCRRFRHVLDLVCKSRTTTKDGDTASPQSFKLRTKLNL